jgi:hypothetical protein
MFSITPKQRQAVEAFLNDVLEPDNKYIWQPYMDKKLESYIQGYRSLKVYSIMNAAARYDLYSERTRRSTLFHFHTEMNRSGYIEKESELLDSFDSDIVLCCSAVIILRDDDLRHTNVTTQLFQYDAVSKYKDMWINKVSKNLDITFACNYNNVYDFWNSFNKYLRRNYSRIQSVLEYQYELKEDDYELPF